MGCGEVWCGVVGCGEVWCGVVRCGEVWWGVVGCGRAGNMYNFTIRYIPHVLLLVSRHLRSRCSFRAAVAWPDEGKEYCCT